MSWLQTSSGGKFSFTDPVQTDVHISDIAHALSNLCRFGGHCRRFYSVAEHSVHVSHLVPAEYALEGLLHDASEAYCVDLPRPIKELLPEYRRIEARISALVRTVYGLPTTESACVKQADNQMLLSERDVLLPPPPIPWTWAEGLKPASRRPMCLPPGDAKVAFLVRFTELQAARNEVER